MKASQRGQTTLVIFYRSGSVAQIIHIANAFPALQGAFETTAQIKEELKITEFHGAFCQKIQTSSGEFFFKSLLRVKNR